MNATMRKIGALSAKDFGDLLKNPVTIICAVMPIGFMFLFRYAMMGDIVAEEATYFKAFLVALGACMTTGMVGTMMILYAIAEEREKHTLRTLMLANVSAGQVLTAKTIVSLVAIAVIDLVCFLVVGVDLSSLPLFLLIALVGSLPIIFLSLVCGLFARDQMSSGIYSLPVLLLALMPMVSMFNETIETISSFSPCGGAFELIMMLFNGNLFTSDAIRPIIVTLAWIAVTIILFVVLYKKVGKDN